MMSLDDIADRLDDVVEDVSDDVDDDPVIMISACFFQQLSARLRLEGTNGIIH